MEIGAMRKQPLRIASLRPPEKVGLPAGVLSVGTEILSVNGQEVRDLIDFYFLTSLEDRIELGVKDDGGTERTVRVAAPVLESLGVEFPPLDFRLCRNKCPFCFVDQNPRGLRPSLAIKDEDYRLSFIYGNYVTLNDVTDEELERIARQRLTPMYVSIHATDDEVRRFLFGRPMKRGILDTLAWLTGRDITVQGQLVVCPGVNDGEVLDRSLSDLFPLHPGLDSVSVVPVGLTGHRDGLVPLRSFTDEECRACLDQVHRRQDRFLERTGGETRFVFASDEFYLRSPYGIPGNDYYGSFPQHDNGVGMARTFLNDLEVNLLGRGSPGEAADAGLGRMPGDFGHQGLWVPPEMPHPVHEVGPDGSVPRGESAAQATAARSRPPGRPAPPGSDSGWEAWRRAGVGGRTRTAHAFTGSLGARFFERFVRPLLAEADLGFRVSVHEIENSLFGPSVTCSGLLSGSDLLGAIRRECRPGDVALIPPNTLSPASLFVDDLTLEELRAGSPCPVVVPGHSFAETLLSL
jgi:putative radical SAM enzyme (TIGR03279 family)